MNEVTQRDLYNSINEFRQEVNSRFDAIEEKYVSRAEFAPVKAIVYTMVGTILLAVLGAVINLTVRASN